MAVIPHRLTKTAMAEGRVRVHAAGVRQTPRATRRARELRRTMTDAEAKRWNRPRNGQLLGTKARVHRGALLGQ
jgi:very-short-patch-repair endonuclease